jgi:hypothetical protein
MQASADADCFRAICAAEFIAVRIGTAGAFKDSPLTAMASSSAW